MNFQEYLIGKKIDPKAFAQSEPGLYSEFDKIFAQMHPESFTAQKLFLINHIRRKYPFQAVEEKAEPTAAPKPRPKIVIKPRPEPSAD